MGEEEGRRGRFEWVNEGGGKGVVDIKRSLNRGCENV